MLLCTLQQNKYIQQAANEHSHVALVSYVHDLSLSLVSIALFLIMRAEAQNTEIREGRGAQTPSQAQGQVHHLTETDNKKVSAEN